MDFSQINSEWLNNTGVDKSNIVVNVPKGTIDKYKYYANELGITGCDITDNEPIPPAPSNNLSFILGLSLGFGIPILAGIIIRIIIWVEKHKKSKEH